MMPKLTAVPATATVAAGVSARLRTASARENGLLAAVAIIVCQLDTRLDVLHGKEADPGQPL
jgi:hypothetical protein